MGLVLPGEPDPAVQLDHLGGHVPEHVDAVPFGERAEHRQVLLRPGCCAHGGVRGRPGRGHFHREVRAPVPQGLEGADRLAELHPALRDSNRLVRMKAAAAVAKFEHETLEILQTVAGSHDRYALHAMIAAVELAGGFDKVIAELADSARHSAAAAILLDALREGAAGLWTSRPANPVIESVFP